MPAPIDLAAVLATFHETWSPRTVALMNDYDVPVVKTHGEFTRHTHPETDEFSLPRGVAHQPVSIGGAEVVLIEPSETVNTGDTPSESTAARRLV